MDEKTEERSFSASLFYIIIIVSIAIVIDVGIGFKEGIKYSKNQVEKQMVENIQVGAFIFNNVTENGALSDKKVVYEVKKRVTTEVVPVEGGDVGESTGNTGGKK